MSKPLLIFNIIVTILLAVGLGIIITGSYLDNEALVHIGLFSSLFVFGVSGLVRMWSDDNV